MEDNKPTGRKKHVSGQVSGVNKREEGLGTGPVGKQDGYQGRKQQYQSQQRPSSGFQSPQGNGTRPSQTFQSSGNSGSTGSGGITRAGKMGIGGILIIALLVFMLYKCACSGRGNLLEGPGGDGGTQQQQQGGGFSDILTSLMSGAGASGSGISQGWVSEANTGKLNTNVVQGSREKRTTILGSNRDVITVMVYMCGTDLESKHGMGSSDIQEMINARYGSNINIILLTGGCKQWKNNIVSSSVNQIYKVESGNFVKLVENAGNDCMTDPDLLAGFIKYCKQNYPANRYDLILWDHGGGSVSGYGYDEKYASKGSMSLKGINEALKKADVKFDFIGFDACLMATLETALMLEPYADYMIASAPKVKDGASQSSITAAGVPGLQWGTGDHNFFAVYPGKDTQSNYEGLPANDVEDDYFVHYTDPDTGADCARLYGTIPANQKVALVGNEYKPNMNYAYMYASTPVEEGESGGVTLSFKPLVTTLEFTLMNLAGNEISENLTKVELTSASTLLSGDFYADITLAGATGYAAEDETNSNTVTIDLPGEGVSLSSTPVKVTFLTLPVEQKDLTLKLYFGANKNTARTLALKQSGEFITVGACKKVYIRNLGIPGTIYILDQLSPISMDHEGGEDALATNFRSYVDGNGTKS